MLKRKTGQCNPVFVLNKQVNQLKTPITEVMTQSEIYQIWKFNMKFRISRENFFRPKIYAVLLDMIRTAAINPIQKVVSLRMQPLENLLTELYTDAGRVMGAHAYQQVKKQAATRKKALMPIGYNEELVNEIIRYFQEHLLDKAVLPITETMKAWILKFVIDQQFTGKSLDMIIEEMVKHDFPRWRSQVIARTEVLRAANYGAMQGARKAGYKMQKRWISAQDFRTRRVPRDEFSHIEANGQIQEMDNPFLIPRRSGGTEQLMQPGDPNGSAADVINCRCTVGFEVLRDANGTPIAL